jgi:uncharacterized protein YjiS (DUF1127 family)
MMSAYETQFRLPILWLRIAAMLRAVEGGVSAATTAWSAWLEKRRLAASSRHDFETMSERTLRDIGLTRADVNRMAWGAPDRYRDPF